MQDLTTIINPIEVKSRLYLDEIKTTIIADEGDNLAACSHLKEVAEYTKAVKLQQAEQERPLKENLAEIKAYFKKPLDFLKEAEQILREKIVDYGNRKEKELEAARLEEKRCLEEKAIEKLDFLELAKQEAAKYDHITRNAVISTLEDKQNETIEQTNINTSVNLSNDLVTFKKLWTFDVVDMSQVPVEFLEINRTAVNNAIKNGAREIAGLKIYQKLTTAVK